MADFPRTILPAEVSIPSFPGSFQSWGQSGKGQLRDSLAVGRIWEEILDRTSEMRRKFVRTPVNSNLLRNRYGVLAGGKLYLDHIALGCLSMVGHKSCVH